MGAIFSASGLSNLLCPAIRRDQTEELTMIGRLNHVAIAVPDLEQAADQYRTALGAKVGAPQDEPDHGDCNFPNLKTPKSNCFTLG